jgi:hypothetical protein
LIRGDSSNVYEIKVDDEVTIDSNWTCQMVVTAALESGAYVINKSLPKNAEETAFLGKLSPAESVLLTGDRYFMIFELENTVKEFRRELQYELKILDGGRVN